jgi:WXG100 family type VII secretion target
MTTLDDSTMAYDYSVCEKVYEELVQDQGTIAAQIASLESTINGLMRTWTGISADQWQNIQGQWMTAIGNMSSDLAKAATALPEMAGNMQRADKGSAARIASIGH